MKKNKFLAFCVITAAGITLSSAALASFNNPIVQIRNITPNTINWNYNPTTPRYCFTSPNHGQILTMTFGVSTLQACRPGDEGTFNLTDLNENVIAKVNTGRGICNLLSSNPPYHVDARFFHNRCIITAQSFSAKTHN